MDELSFRDQAAHQVDDASAAFQASSRPTVPVAAAAVAALAAGAGVALLGQPVDGWGHVAVLALAIALLVVAAAIPTFLRSRSGVHGYRGQVRRDNLVLVLCAVALFVTGLGATPTLGAIFIGLGLVVAVAWFLLLRNVFGVPGGPAQ